MSTDENKQRIIDWAAALNNEVLEGMETLFHDDFVDHNPFAGQTPDKAGYIKLLTQPTRSGSPGTR